MTTRHIVSPKILALLLCLFFLPNPAFSADEVTEISLRRTMCYGKCPYYTVTFNLDGNAAYEGKENVDRIGSFTGMLVKQDFDKLVELIYQNHFFDLKDNYEKDWTDLPATFTSVVRGDTKKTIRNYGGAGPEELQNIELQIDALANSTAWK